MRKGQLFGLLLKLDFGNNDTLKNAAVNIDMPRCPGVLDEETLFLQSIISTEGWSILSAWSIGNSYSNSARTMPISGPLVATVAMSPVIRTRT